MQCPVGEYINGAECEPCAVGYYNDETNQNSCQVCPDGTSTIGTGSDSSSDCIGNTCNADHITSSMGGGDPNIVNSEVQLDIRAKLTTEQKIVVIAMYETKYEKRGE